MATTQPADPRRQSAQTAAKASWMAVLVPIFLHLAVEPALKDAGPNAWMLDLVSLAITVGCYVIGLVAGMLALSRVRSVGREGVLTPALIGTLLNGALLAVMVFAFFRGVRR